MTHKEFTQKWIGKSYEETPWYGIQCVGGAKKYCQERWWTIWSFWWSAINGWKIWMPFNKDWTRVEYTPWSFPPEWALIFWSEKRCLNWHIAVANRFCNKDVLRCFDENGTGKGDPYTHRFYDYKNVLWFFVHN